MALLRSIATVGGYTLASRVLGFARDVLMAAALGAGPVADAFFVAFKLPNFFRRLFAEGAFNAAFIPLFAGRLAAEGEDVARRFAEEVQAVVAMTLLALVLAFEIFMPWLLHVIAPGFADTPARYALTVDLARITMPYLMFISLVSLMGGVLNGLGRFAAAAAAPILLNLCLIGALLAGARVAPSAAHALAWGVALAGVVQALWMVAACYRAGMPLRPAVPRFGPPVRRLVRLMIPGAIGAGVVQINLLIDVVIASLLPLGSISFLFFADRVNQLPLGVVGIAVGTALLPLLTRQLRQGDQEGAASSVNRAIEIGMLLTVPAAVALVAIPGPIVTVLFQRGAFGPDDASATAAALAAYACGLPAYVLIKILAPGFFAREDTATPVKIASACVAINLVLNLLLMGPLAHVGIAAATATSAWINALSLAALLRRRGFLAPDARLRRRLPRIVAASLAMGLGLWALAPMLRPWLYGTMPGQALALAGIVAAGAIVFAALALATGAASGSDLRRFLDRK
ncbi:MAG: murein biosynthesis integral membrane protein MurJ [Acetobacterales bacterium]